MKFDLKVITFSVLAGMVVWISDAFLDHLFFSGKSFLDLLIVDVPGHKLFIRILIVLYFFLFGGVIAGYANKHKKPTEELQDYEFKYKTIADKTNAWEFWKNTAGGYNYVSPAFERITGYLVEDLKQNPGLIKKIIHPDDLERVLKHLEDEVKNTLEIAELEFKIVTQNNEIKKIKHTCQPVYDKNGKFMGSRGSNIEIIKYSLVSDELEFDEALVKTQADTTDDGILAINERGKIVLLNDRFRKMWEIQGNIMPLKDEDKLMEIVLDRLEHPAKLKEIIDYLSDHKTEKSKDQYLLKNGKNFEGYSVPIIDSSGGYHGRVWNFRDTTRYKQVESELKISEEQLKILFEHAPDAFYLQDLKGNFVDSNKAAEILTGYKRGELIDSNFLRLKLLNVSDAIKAARLLAENALRNPTGPEEFIINRKDGKKVPVEIRNFPIEIGNRVLVFGIARDISERKTAEKNLALLNQAIETSREVIFMTDVEGIFTYVNPEFTKMYGFTSEEVVGIETPRILKSGTTSKENYENFWKAILNKESILAKYVNKSKDGKLLDVEASADPVLNDDGDITGFLAIQRDITDHKRAEDEIIKYAKEQEVR